MELNIVRAVSIPMFVFYALSFLRVLAQTFKRRYTAEVTEVTSTFKASFIPSPTEMLLAAIVLDAAELALHYRTPGNTIALSTIALPIFLLLLHIQLYLFAVVLEARRESHQGRSDLFSLAFGMTGLFTNAFTISSLLTVGF